MTVKVLQRVGEQRQGVGSGGVGTDRIDQVVVDLQTLVGRRPAHDLADPRSIGIGPSGIISNGSAPWSAVALIEACCCQAREAIGSDGRDHQDLVAGHGERLPEQVEQPCRIVAPDRKQLLGLIERQHERGVGPVERKTQLAGEGDQLARTVRPARRAVIASRLAGAGRAGRPTPAPRRARPWRRRLGETAGP